ncbi:MAG: hypothetical protein QF410_12450 [Planctomycetota bacterium]|nr:hypothetical protein [Planctomycetota bacterium]MDP6762483.1 hypothetical protein [Planctomycetota bacterium]
MVLLALGSVIGGAWWRVAGRPPVLSGASPAGGSATVLARSPRLASAAPRERVERGPITPRVVPALAGRRADGVVAIAGSRSAASPRPRPAAARERPREASARMRPERPEDYRFDQLVEDLRDDAVPWNATLAGEELSRRLADPGLAYEARRWLELSLRSDDGQERGLAMGLLHDAALSARPDLAPYHPPELLLELTATDLEGWSPLDRPTYIRGAPYDLKSVRFAVAHLDRMEARLTERLRSGPREERFIFAYLLGLGGRRHLASEIAGELIVHLRDNHVSDDALMSMEALHGLGPTVVPWLEANLPDADHQQRGCIELLLLDLADPALTPAARAGRAHLNRVTWKCDDPVRSWSYLSRR